MEFNEAIAVLSALAQATRLDAFRELVKHEPHGLAAGDLARLAKVPQNTLSTHLSVLSQAGLVTSVRRSRSIVYRANLERLRGLAAFLLTDCCGGNAELCGPVMAELAAFSAPKAKAT